MPVLSASGTALYGRDRAWLTDDTVIAQICDEFGCRVASAPWPLLAPWNTFVGHGCNAIAAGEGRWLAQLVGLGVFNSTGVLPSPIPGAQMGLACDIQAARGLAATDGTIALVLDYHAGHGLRLVAVDGTFVDYDVWPQAQVAVVDRTRALFFDWHWNELSSVGGLPLPQPRIAGPVYWPTVLEIAGAFWLLYHDANRIVLCSFSDTTVGFVLPAGFYPHAVVMSPLGVSDGTIKAAWAHGPDDTVGDSRIIDVNTEPRVSLVPPVVEAPLPVLGAWRRFGFFCGTPASGGGWNTSVDPRTLPGNFFVSVPSGELLTYSGEPVT
jgi:hypothetical protein